MNLNLHEKKFLRHFKHIPIGCTGLGLGLAGLGALWTNVIKDATNIKSPSSDQLALFSIIQFVLTFFTILFVFLILIRNFTHKNTFINEIQHPLLSSFFPTLFMSIMMIAGLFGWIGNITKNSHNDMVIDNIASVIWLIGVIGHFSIFAFFLYHIVRKHDIKSDNLFASWFVPPVGIIVSCTVCPNLSASWIPNQLFQAIWYFGFALYLIILPIVSYKLIFHRTEDKNTFPSVAIYGAPANLSLAGFLSVFTNKTSDGIYECVYGVGANGFVTVMVILLTILGIGTTLVVYLMLFRIFKIRFNPVYASLTFPLAIGATAIYKSSDYLHHLSKQSLDFVDEAFWTIRVIAYIELAIATIIIAYVFVRYLILIINKLVLSEIKK